MMLHPGAFYPPGWAARAAGAAPSPCPAPLPGAAGAVQPGSSVLRGFKLFRVRRDGSLGPLFINKRQRVSIGVWLPAEDHPTKGFAHRPGWHICSEKLAPHLRQGGDRSWFEVEFSGETPHPRPPSQGGLWFTAKMMRVVGPA